MIKIQITLGSLAEVIDGDDYEMADEAQEMGRLIAGGSPAECCFLCDRQFPVEPPTLPALVLDLRDTARHGDMYPICGECADCGDEITIRVYARLKDKLEQIVGVQDLSVTEAAWTCAPPSTH